MTALYKSNLRTALLAISCLASVTGYSATNGESHFRKSWQFKRDNGIVTIGLVTPIDLQSRPLPPSLEIIYSGESQPPLIEEAKFIREVLQNLPALGIDPHNLSSIAMPGPSEPDVRQRVTLAALDSAEWRNFAQTGTGSAELIFGRLLNDLRAYDLLNDVLKEYGLHVKTIGAEKVAAAKCLDLKIPDLPCSVRHNPSLPAGASLSVVLEKKG